MDAVARAYWPTTLPLLQRLALPSYVGFGFCLALESTAAKFSFAFDSCSDCFGQKPLPLIRQAAIRENASMSKGIVEETVYVVLFRCEKCNRPIISWRLSPNHGGYSLEKAQTKSLPLTCVMEECGWSEVRFGCDAIESWAVPWTYAITGPFDQS